MVALAETKPAGSRKDATALTVLLFLAPLATAAVPKLTWLFLLLVASGVLFGFWRRGGDWRRLFQPNAAFLAILAVALYALLSAAWSADPGASLSKAVLLLAVVLVTLAASNAIGAWDRTELRQAALAFAVGVFLGAIYVLVGILTDNAVKHMTEIALDEDGEAPAKFNLGVLRQNVTILVLHLWPALLALTAVARPSCRRAFSLIFLAAVTVPVLLSERESAQIGLIGAALIFAMAWMWRRGTSRVLAIAWCLAFALVLPLAFAAYQADLHMEHLLPRSARARIILWEFTAEHIFETPWVGIGADATQEMHKSLRIEQPEDFVYPRTTGPHAHSLFLQVWYELGLVGAALAALAGATTALRTTSLSPEAQPFAAATFAAYGLSVAFAWGVWQTWLLCGMALTLLYLLIAAHAATEWAASAKQRAD